MIWTHSPSGYKDVCSHIDYHLKDDIILASL